MCMCKCFYVYVYQSFFFPVKLIHSRFKVWLLLWMKFYSFIFKLYSLLMKLKLFTPNLSTIIPQFEFFFVVLVKFIIHFKWNWWICIAQKFCGLMVYIHSPVVSSACPFALVYMAKQDSAHYCVVFLYCLSSVLCWWKSYACQEEFFSILMKNLNPQIQEIHRPQAE